MILLTVLGTHQADIMTWLDHELQPGRGKIENKKWENWTKLSFQSLVQHLTISQDPILPHDLTISFQKLICPPCSQSGSVCDDGSNDAGPGHNCGDCERGGMMVTSPRLLTNGQDFLHHYFCPRHTESNRTEVICSDISYGTQERDQVKLFFLAIIHWFS